MQIKTVYTLWIAAILSREGFQIIDIRPNPTHPWLKCYDFEETPEFIEAFTRVSHMKRKH